MKGQLTAETAVGVPAAALWEVYRGLELGRVVDQLLPDVIGRVEVVEGDGSVGTIVKLTFPPGTLGDGYLKEVFVKIDDENRVKETEVIEGGYKSIGFDRCSFLLEIIEKGAESSIVRSSVLYELDDTKAELFSHLSTGQLEIMAETMAKYVVEKQKSTA